MADKQSVLDAIEGYFYDTSRTAEQTRAGLESIRDQLDILIDTLPESDIEDDG